MNAEKKRFQLRVVMGSVMLVVLAIDRISKLAVRRYFQDEETLTGIKAAGDFFNIIYVTNRGAILGIFGDSPLLLSILSVIAALLIITYAIHQQAADPLMFPAFGCILGGAGGNLYERFRYGSVTDFLDFKFLDLSFVEKLPFFLQRPAANFIRFPAFNIADTAIVIGIFLIILSSLTETRRQKKRGLFGKTDSGISPAPNHGLGKNQMDGP